MSNPTTGRRLYASLPAISAGLIFTSVGLVFNSTYGYSMGGDDIARKFGMAAVMVGCIFLKDYLPGQAFVAFKSRSYGLGICCCLGAVLGAMFSFIAAFGSASDGQAEKANPLQVQIDAYNAATRTEAELTRRLDQLADTQPPQGSEPALVANLEKAIKAADPTVRARTAGCTKMVGFGPKATQWNAENCDSIISARAALEAFKSAQQRADNKDKEAETIRAKLESIRKVIAKGAPKSADALNANFSDLWKKLTGQGNVQVSSIISLLCALIVEIGGPIAWATVALSNSGSDGSTRVPTSSTTDYPPKPPKTRKRFRVARSDKQKNANLIASEMRKRGQVPRVSLVRSEYMQRFGQELPKVTAHRAVGN